jgi:hypothetical protein
MYVRNHTTAGNGCLNKCVQLFVASDGELQVSWSNTFYLCASRSVSIEKLSLHVKYLKILGSVSGEFQHFRREILCR